MMMSKENRESLELRASCFWLEKIDDILQQYRSEPSWRSFVQTKAIFKRIVEHGEFPSAVVLSHIFTILEYCQEAIRDTIYDGKHTDKDVWQPEKDEKGKAKELTMKVVYLPPKPPAAKSQAQPAEKDEEDEEDDDE